MELFAVDCRPEPLAIEIGVDVLDLDSPHSRGGTKKGRAVREVREARESNATSQHRVTGPFL
jgi:hypothetical protein